MNQPFDQDLDSLDLYMEVLRIVHHHPRSNTAAVFSHATLAMDEASCHSALESLAHQGLLQSASSLYSITASGVQTLIPVKRDGKFPSSAPQSYVNVLPVSPVVATLQVTTKNGVCTICKNGISLSLSAAEMQQLWKKLQREADHHA